MRARYSCSFANRRAQPSCNSKNLAVKDEIPLEWAQLPAPWHTAFELAWEGLLAGSPPVGAVVVNQTGRVIARGRSRRHEATAPVGQLAGSRLAHAEVNALATLPVDLAEEIWLYVTLEPCYLCTAAAAISHVAGVSFAGSDPMWRFLEDIATFHPGATAAPLRAARANAGTDRRVGDALAAHRTGSPESDRRGRIDAFETVGGELVDYARAASSRAAARLN